MAQALHKTDGTEFEVLELLYRIADRVAIWCDKPKESRYQADVLELLPQLWLVAPDKSAWQLAREAVGRLLTRRALVESQATLPDGEQVDVAALNKLTYAGRLVELMLQAAGPQPEGAAAEADRIKVVANGKPIGVMALLQTFDREVKGMLEQRAAGIVQGRFEERLSHIELILDEFIENLGVAVGRDKQVLDGEPLADFVTRTSSGGAKIDV